MSIEEIMKEMAETIKQLPCLYSTPVLIADPGDNTNDIQTLFGKVSRCVLVMFGGCQPVKQGNGTLFDRVKIVVRCYDRPSLTRAEHPNCTLLGMARIIAHSLHGCKAQNMTSCLYYRGISEITYYNNVSLICDVEFDTITE